MNNLWMCQPVAFAFCLEARFYGPGPLNFGSAICSLAVSAHFEWAKSNFIDPGARQIVCRLPSISDLQQPAVFKGIRFKPLKALPPDSQFPVWNRRIRRTDFCPKLRCSRYCEFFAAVCSSPFSTAFNMSFALHQVKSRHYRMSM